MAYRRFGLAAFATVALVTAALAIVVPAAVDAAELQEPPLFQSLEGKLDVIVTATAAPVMLGDVETTAWVYEVCRRASATATTCLPGTTQRPYGGVLLGLQPNDTVHLRLVNNLPPVPDARHCAENPDLANNPTNLHTHGLIVEPHRASGPGDTYGDYVFVEVRNPANHSSCADAGAGAGAGAAAPAHHGGHAGTDMAMGAVEYTINLDKHPAGVYWFHPHMHGVALNQVTSGMAGVITVGRPDDACGRDLGCRAAVNASTVRLMVLKESEVLADGTLLSQQDPGFCAPTPAAGEGPRQGRCPGLADAGFANGRWIHSINGQVYPDVHVGAGGDIWRIVNAAASRSFDLFLAPDEGGDPLPLQVLSIDGITIDAAKASNLPALQAQFGSKAQLFNCPVAPGARAGHWVCTRHVRMMPSARVTVRVLNDRAQAQHAVLRTADVATGPDADDWPQVDLASVEMDAPMSGLATALNLLNGVRAVLSSGGVLGHAPTLMAPGAERPTPLSQVQAKMRGRSSAEPPAAEPPAAGQPGLTQASEYAIDPSLKFGLKAAPECSNLAPGEHRRIYFGNPTPDRDGFGLATAVIDAHGQEKPGTLTPMRTFDPSKTTICLTAARGRRPTTETWELVNATGEDHNFHIHQTRFWLLTNGPSQPGRIDDAAVLQDNVPVPHAADVSGCDGTIDHVRNGQCNPQPVVVRIPFTEIGDFVFHCHILEHEDGGMMARIRVVAPPVSPSGKYRS